MNFVIKNYFIFFDIIQKAIRKMFKSIDAEHAELKLNVHSNLKLEIFAQYLKDKLEFSAISRSQPEESSQVK